MLNNPVVIKNAGRMTAREDGRVLTYWNKGKLKAINKAANDFVDEQHIDPFTNGKRFLYKSTTDDFKDRWCCLAPTLQRQRSPGTTKLDQRGVIEMQSFKAAPFNETPFDLEILRNGTFRLRFPANIKSFEDNYPWADEEPDADAPLNDDDGFGSALLGSNHIQVYLDVMNFVSHKDFSIRLLDFLRGCGYGHPAEEFSEAHTALRNWTRELARSAKLKNKK